YGPTTWKGYANPMLLSTGFHSFFQVPNWLFGAVSRVRVIEPRISNRHHSPPGVGEGPNDGNAPHFRSNSRQKSCFCGTEPLAVEWHGGFPGLPFQPCTS